MTYHGTNILIFYGHTVGLIDEDDRQEFFYDASRPSGINVGGRTRTHRNDGLPRFSNTAHPISDVLRRPHQGINSADLVYKKSRVMNDKWYISTYLPLSSRSSFLAGTIANS